MALSSWCMVRDWVYDVRDHEHCSYKKCTCSCHAEKTE